MPANQWIRGVRFTSGVPGGGVVNIGYGGSISFSVAVDVAGDDGVIVTSPSLDTSVEWSMPGFDPGRYDLSGFPISVPSYNVGSLSGGTYTAPSTGPAKGALICAFSRAILTQGLAIALSETYIRRVKTQVVLGVHNSFNPAKSYQFNPDKDVDGPGKDGAVEALTEPSRVGPKYALVCVAFG